MAHNLNFNEGLQRHAFFSVKEKPWHGLGTIVENALTTEQAIIEAGLNYHVKKANLTAYVNGKQKKVADRFALYRQDTGDIFGTCSHKYEILQNREAFGFFDSIVGEGEAIFETAGALGKGERIFITAKLPDYIKVDDTDLIEQYLFLTSSHDGSGAVTCAFTPIRIVCNNTLNFALANCSNRFTALHFKNMKSKLESAGKIMGMVNKVSELLSESYQRMAAKNIVSEDLRNIVIKSLAPTKEVYQQGLIDLSDCSSQFQTAVNDCLNYAEVSETQQMATTKGTLFGAYNAVTGFYQNVKDYKTQEKKIDSILYAGHAAIRSQKAFDICMDYLNN